MESDQLPSIHYPSLALGVLALAIAVLLPLFGAVLSALGAALALDARRDYRFKPGLIVSLTALAASVIAYVVAAVVLM